MKREGASLPAETRRTLMAAVALNAPDPTALAMLTDTDADTWLNFYPREEKPKVTTNDAIDTFSPLTAACRRSGGRASRATDF